MSKDIINFDAIRLTTELNKYQRHKEIPNSKIFLTENLGHRRILRDEQVSQSIVNFLK